MTDSIKPKRAFTLVELLVVIALMAILASMMTFAMAGARQEAREKRAQAEIAALSSVILQKLNEINLAPLVFVPNDVDRMNVGTVVVKNGIEHNRTIMLARRDLSRMILPQCRADLIYPPARLQFRKSTGTNTAIPGVVKIREPAEWAAMRKTAGFINSSGAEIESTIPPANTVFGVAAQDPLNGPNGYFTAVNLRNAIGAIRNNGTGGTPPEFIDLTTRPWGTDLTIDTGNEIAWSREYESAECLYLILASTESFGERALDQFSSRMIANLDGDNVPEIVDPWGVPYEFFREAPGFGFEPPMDPLIVAHPAGADGNDYLRTDLRYQFPLPSTTTDDPFRTVPLIVSAGIDGVFGIRRSFDKDGAVIDGTAGISPRSSISVMRLRPSTTNPVSPSPTYAGSYQYPDPFMAFNSNEDNDPTNPVPTNPVFMSEVGPRTYDAWFYGAGLGATFDNNDARDAAVDNIYSTPLVGGSQ